MKKIITIATGTEIMLGLTVDQDFQYMAQELAKIGSPVNRHYVVGDDPEELRNVFSDAVHQADIIILTGGLGPTTDDITRDVVSEALHLPLKLDQEILNDLMNKFKVRGLEFVECNKQQAFVLQGAQIIPNKIGTAPGMHLEYKGKKIFLLPGPPFEFQPMFKRGVIPKIKDLSDLDSIRFLTFRTFGVRESEVQQLMTTLFHQESSFLNGLGYCSTPEGVDIRVSAKEKDWEFIKPVIHRIEETLKPWIYGKDDQSLHEVTAQLLIEKRKTLSVAESCTGGLLSQRLTRFPGVSEVFKLGMVVYSNTSKVALLNVSEKDLNQWGAVSEGVALQMAQGIRDKGGTDLGLSITGIAGPAGGTAEKPVGLVWIGCYNGKTSQAVSFNFLGTREVIQFKASQAALDILRRFLIEEGNLEREIQV
jgi:nicotinamide-nucleotide amidase